jgi:peroxiredoxin
MKRLTTPEILTLIGVAVAFVLAYVLINGNGLETSDTATGLPFAVISPGKAVPAPNFTLKTSKGVTVTLDQAISKGPVVIDFWEVWCGPCKLELPEIDAINRAYRARGVQVYGIETAANAAQVNHFFSQYGVSFPTLVDPHGDVNIAYGVQSVPRVIVIDRQGKLRSENDGFDPNTQRDLSACLDSLLKEQ